MKAESEAPDVLEGAAGPSAPDMVLMSSVNLTNRGLSDNIEVGELMADETIAGRLDAHFRSSMRPEARCLTLVTPRDRGDRNKLR